MGAWLSDVYTDLNKGLQINLSNLEEVFHIARHCGLGWKLCFGVKHANYLDEIRILDDRERPV